MEKEEGEGRHPSGASSAHSVTMVWNTGRLGRSTGQRECATRQRTRQEQKVIAKSTVRELLMRLSLFPISQKSCYEAPSRTRGFDLLAESGCQTRRSAVVVP